MARVPKILIVIGLIERTKDNNKKLNLCTQAEEMLDSLKCTKERQMQTSTTFTKTSILPKLITSAEEKLDQIYQNMNT